MVEHILAACGNDCSVCPRYVTYPYEKSPEELRHTAELWERIGYRDHVVSSDEISCTGCKPSNWCRYHIVSCCAGKDIETCAECPEYPCKRMRKCFDATSSFQPMCRHVCTDEEYERIRKAFFEKKANLDDAASRFASR